MLVLAETDWASRTETPLYGLPNASNGTLVVAGTEAPFWGQLIDMVAEPDLPELARVYGNGDDGAIRLGPFFDLVAVHEVAHIFHEGSQHCPTGRPSGKSRTTSDKVSYVCKVISA